MKSSLFALAFVLLCTNHAFAFSDSECMDMKNEVRSYLKQYEKLEEFIEAGVAVRDIDAEKREHAIKMATSFSTIYATFCKN